ncbi:BA14K family protein [Roseibium sp.]|uniref:BA14K family protein n=1 Tax=Roseibium sp. TaxID=1936156 RepID=UPI003A9742F6
MIKNFALSAAAVVIATGMFVSAGTGTAEAGNGWQPGVAAAGGFVAGALVGSALSQPRYTSPPPQAYYAPAPQPVYYSPEPWTPEWYQYCSSKYRSFNPRTGYFLAYSGQLKFCR